MSKSPIDFPNQELVSFLIDRLSGGYYYRYGFSLPHPFVHASPTSPPFYIRERAPKYEKTKDTDSLIEDSEISTGDAWFDSLLAEKVKKVFRGGKFFEHQYEAIAAIRKTITEQAEHEKSVILWAGTGGGKTEGFLIPVLQHCFETIGETTGTKAFIFYPRKALLYDQASRICRFLIKINNKLKERGLSPLRLGIYTGESPSVYSRSGRFVIREMGKKVELDPNTDYRFPLSYCTNELQKGEGEKALCMNDEFRFDTSLKCFKCSNPECGKIYDFVYITEREIEKQKPEIVIATPDKINSKLHWKHPQGVGFHGLLRHVQFLIFDEIHLYAGVFGTNIAHLIRRLKRMITEYRGRSPLLIGSSATIPNLEDFGEKLFGNSVIPIKGKAKESESLDRLHTFLLPYGLSQEDLNNEGIVLSQFRGQKVESLEWWQRFRRLPSVATTSIMCLGHAIREDSFRKILVFCNRRADVEEIYNDVYERESNRKFSLQESREFTWGTGLDENQHQELLEKIKVPENKRKLKTLIKDMQRYLWAPSNKSLDIDEAIRLGMPLHSQPLRVDMHRAGIPPQYRIRAEKRFKSGESDIIVSTSTLELGIDIGSITTIFNVGAPPNINSYIQRIGRGGRRGKSLAINVLDPSAPLDLYYFRHPHELANTDPEKVPLNVENKVIAQQQMKASVVEFLLCKGILKIQDMLNRYLKEELPPDLESWFDDIEHDVFLGNKQEFLRVLEMCWTDIYSRAIEKMEKGRTWINQVFFPHVEANLRRVGESIDCECRGKYIDSQNMGSALRNYFPKSIIRAQGYTYRIGRDNSIHFDRSAGQTVKAFLKRNRRSLEPQLRGQEILVDFEDILDNIRVPKTISGHGVEPFPNRFFCTNPSCTERWKYKTARDVNFPWSRTCPKCREQLSQFSQMYVCDKCGEFFQYNPPRVCKKCLKSNPHEGDFTYEGGGRFKCRRTGGWFAHHPIRRCTSCGNELSTKNLKRVIGPYPVYLQKGIERDELGKRKLAKKFSFVQTKDDEKILIKVNTSATLDLSLIDLDIFTLVYGWRKYYGKEHRLSYQDQNIYYGHMFKTQALKITFPQSLIDSIRARYSSVEASEKVSSFLHTFVHIIRVASPRVTGSLLTETGEIVVPNDNAVYIFDSNEGGSGICKLMLEEMEKLLGTARDILSECPSCGVLNGTGCPHCLLVKYFCPTWDRRPPIDRNLVMNFFFRDVSA